jgi:DNA excision repair protein ERCC-4
MSILLDYENQLFQDIFQNDALLIMAKGLGIERIFTNFIKLYSDPSHLVIILNTHEAEETYFINKLKSAKELDMIIPARITTETFSLNDRTEAYMKGGCFFITSRILGI